MQGQWRPTPGHTCILNYEFTPAETPFYQLVPKDPDEHLRYRLDVIKLAAEDDDYKRDLIRMCSRDILFWVNTFGWTFDPRLPAGKRILPMNTFPFQDEGILATQEAVANQHDIVKVKSREMGASWICCFVATWFWQFQEWVSGLMVSRTQELVDSPGNMKALLQKVDFIVKHEPGWMRPEVDSTFMYRRNVDTNSVIAGETTNPASSAGDRLTFILFDEFGRVDQMRPGLSYEMMGASADATNCRILNSTPQGMGNAFADKAHDGTPRIDYDWTMDPRKTADLTIDSNGEPTSAWFRDRCARAAHPAEIASQILRSFTGSDQQYFPAGLMNHLRNDCVRTPLLRGKVEHDEQGQFKEFTELGNGELRLWLALVGLRPPSDRQYVIGADIATGTVDASGRGASNSALCVIDRTTREQVGEFVQHGIEPHFFARQAVALARWFGNAFLIWEATGPGGLFGSEVMRLGYFRFYFDVKKQKSIRQEQGDVPGFWATTEKKRAGFGALRRALLDDKFTPRSPEIVSEMERYIWTRDNSIEHSSARRTLDTSGARSNHSDRVIAMMVANWALEGEPDPKAEEVEEHVPLGSIASRREERRKRKARAAEDGWGESESVTTYLEDYQ